MKITINLSDGETKGIKEYLKMVGDGDVVTKTVIAAYIHNILAATFQNPHDAVNDYIKKHDGSYTGF